MNAVHFRRRISADFESPYALCLALEPRARAAQHMEVQMIDLLPALRASIGHHAKAALGVGLAALLQGQARR